MKRCGFCKEKKPIDDFYADRSRGDGLSTLCKLCVRIRFKNSRERNPATFKKKEQNYYTKNKQKILERRQEWYKKNRHKALAHEAVKRALFRGELVRMPCEVCGDTKVVGHHDDYSKPVDVRWLCPKHHMILHHGK